MMVSMRYEECLHDVLIDDSYIDAVVDFERTQYTVREDHGSLEVCVQVTNPPHHRELSIDIDVDYICSPGSASKSSR